MQVLHLDFPQGLHSPSFTQAVSDEVAAGRLPSLAPVTRPGAPGPMAVYTLYESAANTMTLYITLTGKDISEADAATLRTMAAAHTGVAPTPGGETARPQRVPLLLLNKLRNGTALTQAEQDTVLKWLVLSLRRLNILVAGAPE